MRRLTAALVLLALLLTGCVWSLRSVEKVCTEAAEALYAGELNRARAIWGRRSRCSALCSPTRRSTRPVCSSSGLRQRMTERMTKICSTVRSCSPGCIIFPRWKRRPCATYCKACRKNCAFRQALCCENAGKMVCSCQR